MLEVDARRLGPALREAARQGAHRPDAVRGLARLHDPEAVPLLLRALRDPAPEVRAAAGLGLGALEGALPDLAAARLALATSIEEDPAVRAALLRDVGRAAPPTVGAVLLPGLDAGSSTVRAGAAYGVHEALVRGADIPSATLSQVADLLEEQAAEPRLAAAFTLARASPARLRRANVQGALMARLQDPDPEVRRFVVRALGRIADTPASTIATFATDSDWRVAVEAVRALARLGSPPIIAEALERVDALARGGEPSRLHVLLAAVDSARPVARTEPVYRMADRLFGARFPRPHTPWHGLHHCALAELVDVGRGWPTRLTGCGLDQISAADRRRRTARLLGNLDGAEEPRFGRLRRLIQDDEPHVRAAAAVALGSLSFPGAVEVLRNHVSRETHPGALAAALQALSTAVLRERPDGLADALRAALDRLDGPGAVEALQLWVEVVEGAELLDLEPELRRLTGDPHAVLAERAQRALERLGLPHEGRRRDPFPNPARRTPRPVPTRWTLETSRGSMALELWPDEAPYTVDRITALARDGFYDDLSFHRVVPGFVVQGGDPQGDGYGGPGWTQRCEDHRRPYVRGTVGVALAGRDTGGSQFFITHGREPHLDTRYTAFAQVVEGFEVLDALQEGDRILGFTPTTADTP
jgi:cyclophilin family peptidyl-prolyl cis-trans isomerase/HEAT repeat protein